LGSTPVAADKTLAHSKSLGMSFVALGDPWCAATVNLRVESEDAARFSTPDYGSILQRLGQVLAQECPQAGQLNISGMAAGQLAWSGTADKASGWVARPIPREEATLAVQDQPAAVAEPAAPAETAVPTRAAPLSPPLVGSGEAEPAVTPAPVIAPQATPQVEAVTTAEPPPALLQMEIAGWQPGGLLLHDASAGAMTEIPGRDSPCLIRTLQEVKPELRPVFTLNREFSCAAGYVHSTDLRRYNRAALYYQGQSQAFGAIDGFWFDGYNFDRGKPKQVVARYRTTSRDQWNRVSQADKILVWVGEDRELRVHYFAGYTYQNQVWRLDHGAPFIVLTDNGTLKEAPDQTALAQSLATMFRDFMGYTSLEQFADVPFVIVDLLHNAPGHKQLAASVADLDPALYKEGRAVRHRGMPWTLEVRRDFVAMRAAQVEAERRRAEAEQQRLAALRAQHQASLDQQYELLAKATAYDRLRFYATLMMARERMDGMKIDFTSNRLHGGNPLDRAVLFTHPAMFAMQAADGEVNLGGSMYMLVEGKKGHIEKPYPMQVEYNETPEKIAGWMLVRVAPRFAFSFDKKGKPVFGISVEEAISCKSDKCLEEMDAATMMKTWYDDGDMNFAMASDR
jgi:hypothetical protein